MQRNHSSKNSSRRDLLRYASLAGVVGFSGFTGLKSVSKPAIAAPTGTPSIANGIFAGSHQVSSYDIEYQNLDTSNDIEITYIFTDSSNTETTSTHPVGLSGEPESGTVSTGSHSVTVPSGDIQLGIELSHPSLSSEVSTNPSSVSTVYPDVIDASGGTTVVDKTIGGQDYRIHAFENVGNDTFTVDSAPSDATVDVLVVGGGGGASGGGGGGGGARFETTTLSSGTYSVNVGDGGSNSFPDAGTGSQGQSSSFDTFTVSGGGGGGGNRGDDASSGASGGGGGHDCGNGGSSTQFGNRGGDAVAGNCGGVGAAGGGGAGVRAPDHRETLTFNGFTLKGGGDRNNIGSVNAGDGGIGADFSDKFGTTFGEDGFFGGGGGGGVNQNQGDVGGTIPGGKGGGGDGSTSDARSGSGIPGDDGMDNTGGGGGGSDWEANSAGSGGSGIVLIRYKI